MPQKVSIEIGPFKDRRMASRALGLVLRTYPMETYETTVGTPLDKNGNYWVRGTRNVGKEEQ